MCAQMWPPGPVWVVLPTYNERPNLEPLVRAVRSVLDSCAPKHVILVVDDRSPDGTGELADRLAASDPHVRVLHRGEERGLGRAYLDGFERALAEGAALVIEMDADFSHDPLHLPELIDAARGADLVLGSRYVPGGGVRDWGRRRRLVSRAGCRYARAMLGVELRDLTGGFKCFRREVLEAVDLESVRARGYAFQVELTYRALRAGFRIEEIPILFSERRAGRSKMSRRIMLEAAWVVPRLRFGARSPEHAARDTADPASDPENGNSSPGL